MIKNVTINLETGTGHKAENPSGIHPSGIQLHLHDQDRKLTVTGLPENHELVHIARLYDERFVGTIYYVTHQSTGGVRSADYFGGGLSLHVGRENQLVEAKLVSIETKRDGGTTIIDFRFDEEGTPQKLCFPSKTRNDKPSVTYEGKRFELEMLLSPAYMKHGDSPR